MKTKLLTVICLIFVAGFGYGASESEKTDSQEHRSRPSPSDSMDSEREKLRADVIKRFDKDGDGKLNDEEYAEFKRAMEAERESRGMK